MQLNMNEITFYRYVYSIRNVELTINRDTYAYQDGSCAYLYIRHDYQNRILPIIQMGLEMDSDMIQLFYENEDSVKLKLDIYEQQMNENSEVMNTSLFLRKSFTCIPARDQSTYVTTPDTVSKEMVDTMRKLQLFEMYLIDMDIVNKFNQEISLVLDRASKSAILQSIFVSREFPAGLVVATPPMNDNVLSYPSVSLGDLVTNINELNLAYGLYDAYPFIYDDYKYLYCINPYNPNISIQDATDFNNVTFMMFSTSSPEHNITGSCDDLQLQTHIINVKNMPEIYNTEMKDTSTKFSTVLTVDSSGNVTKQTVDENVTKMHFTRQYNELTQQQIIHQNLYGHTIRMTITDCSVSCLRPFKKFTFDVDAEYADKGLTGHEYRLTALDIFFERDSNLKYTHDARITIVCPKHITEQ